MTSWPAAFALTVAVELAAALVLLRTATALSWPRIAVGVVVANVVTHPLFWLATDAVDDHGAAWITVVLAGEVVVVGVEMLVLHVLFGRHRPPGRLLVASVVAANGLSAATGLVVALAT